MKGLTKIITMSVRSLGGGRGVVKGLRRLTHCFKLTFALVHQVQVLQEVVRELNTFNPSNDMSKSVVRVHTLHHRDP